MIARTQTGRLKLLSILRHGVVGVAALFLVAAGGFGMEIVLRNREAANLDHENANLSQQLQVAKGEVQRADKIATDSVPTDLRAVGKLQSAIDKKAAARHCNVVEFHASAEVAQYLTRFAKNSSPSDWGQVGVQVSIAGTAKNVLATLSGLTDAQVPFEFDTLEITRDKVDELGEATVIAHASLRVLIRTSKETA